MKNKNNDFKFKKKNQKEKATLENYTKIFNNILNNDKEKDSYSKIQPKKIIETKHGKQKSKNTIEKKIDQIIKTNNPLKPFIHHSKKNNTSNKKHYFTKNNTNRKNLKELKIENFNELCLNKTKRHPILKSDENIIVTGSDKYNSIKRNSISTKKLPIKKPILRINKSEDTDDEYYLINQNSAKINFNKKYNTKENINKVKLSKNNYKKDACKNKIIEISENSQKYDNSGQNNLVSPIPKKYFVKNKLVPKNPLIYNKNEILQNKKTTKIDQKNTKFKYNKIKINNSIDMNYITNKKDTPKNKKNNKNILNSNSSSNNNIDNLNFTFNNNINNKNLIINNANNNINININISNINNNSHIENTNEKNFINKEILGDSYSRSDNKIIQLSENNINKRIDTFNLLNFNKKQQQFLKQKNENENEKLCTIINQNSHNKKFFYYRNLNNKGIQVESININLCKDSNDKTNKDNEECLDDWSSNKSSISFSVKSGNLNSKRFKSLSKERDKHKLKHSKDTQENDFMSVIGKKLSTLVDDLHSKDFGSTKVSYIRSGIGKYMKNQRSNKTSTKSFNSIY